MAEPKQKWIYYFHWPLLGGLVLLLALGMINLKSAAPVGSGYWAKQGLWMGLGFGALGFSFVLSRHFWERLTWPLYLFALGLLALVWLVGYEVGGQQNWLKVGSFRFQPSELAKLATLILLSWHFAKYPRLKKIKDFLLPGLYAGLPLLLVLAVGDLGGAFFFVLLSLTFLFLAGAPKKFLALLLLLGILVGVGGYYSVLKPYQKQRIQAFLNPQASPQGYGYHLFQSRIAVGSGGLWGKGYQQGNTHQLKFLPEQHTDFVFSVLAEEWGLAGASVALLAFLAFLLSLFHCASKMKDLFATYLAAGVGALLFWQVFLNLGGVLGLLPLAGVTLPFFSYGGSALLSNFFAVGIVLGLYVRRYTF